MDKNEQLPFRIGHGFDVHAFCPGDHVMLGGVRIVSDFGLQAHSDGDVVLHAICDAMLGAAGCGDIGQHFPDTDSRYKNIDSSMLLQHVCRLINETGYKLANLDVTVVAQYPKLAPHISAMCQRIAEISDSCTSQINVKATTTEQLGYIGRKEGIAVHAVVLLISAPD